MGQQAKFIIEKRVKVEGRWRLCQLAILGNNRAKPHLVVVNNVEELHKEVY